MLVQVGDAFERYLERVPAAFAVTRGAEHTLVYANAAFRRLTSPAGDLAPGTRVSDLLPGLAASGLTDVLDRVRRTGLVERDCSIASADTDALAWCCTVWPAVGPQGTPKHLVIEIWVATQAKSMLALQKDVTERMLLSALRESEIANEAEASQRRAAFLASEGRRLVESLDEQMTLRAITGLSLPYLGAWCVVDLVESDGTMRRLAIIHADPAKQRLASELEGRWSPMPDDSFGAPAALRHNQPIVIAADLDAALVAGTHDPETLRALRDLGVGPLLTVPLVIHKRLVGALTFVGGPDQTYTPEDVVLAEDLAIRSAIALDNARMHGEAVALKAKAEAASEAKSAFLGMMSHELRTPLNAIGGYVDLIDMGLRGPVTTEQHTDLVRIRSNQRHLLALVSDVLNFVQLGAGRLSYDMADVVAEEVVTDAVALVEPLMLKKRLILEHAAPKESSVVRTDRERMRQILLNLLSNAIKFTPPRGRIAVAYEVMEHVVLVHVADTGVGVPSDKVEAIFEPFVQVNSGLARGDGGVGLGLAISRDLARAMGGDITVKSAPGAGSTFTLSLPIAEQSPRHQS